MTDTVEHFGKNPAYKNINQSQYINVVNKPEPSIIRKFVSTISQVIVETFIIDDNDNDTEEIIVYPFET